MLHIPILRKGRPYSSLDRSRAVHYRTREPFVEISQANAGLIRRDLLDQETSRSALARVPVRELIGMCRSAAEHFLYDPLPLGETTQTPTDYVHQLSATTGMPHVLGRRNMHKIHAMLSGMETVLAGLTRGVSFDLFDQGHASGLSFFPRAQSLGGVLPSNSPGVHSLWIPSIAMKTPLVLKPGGAEPWTPYRITQALLKAGVPAEAFSYYPTDHAGANEILRSCGRGMLFGDVGAVKHWARDPRVELHGPGYSKILLGPDAAADFERYLDVMVEAIVSNGGRSCVNASGVWTVSHGDRIAEALAERLAAIQPHAEEDPEAQIAPFADPGVAARINSLVDQGLAVPGATEMTHRVQGRMVEWGGCTYLLPTIVRCKSSEHPLANREFLFPYASVVQVSQSEMLSQIGPSLVVTAITKNKEFEEQLLESPLIQRLNLGPIPTMKISWDQPHEGNMFEFLYRRRAIARLNTASQKSV